MILRFAPPVLLAAALFSSVLAATACPAGPAMNEPSPARTPTALAGHWRGELSGGPIGAVQTWSFTPDGHYRMTGYPSIGERGRWAVTGREGQRLRVRFTARKRCGPCEGGVFELAPDVEETLELSEDGKRLKHRGWELVSVAEP